MIPLIGQLYRLDDKPVMVESLEDLPHASLLPRVCQIAPTAFLAWRKLSRELNKLSAPATERIWAQMLLDRAIDSCGHLRRQDTLRLSGRRVPLQNRLGSD
jgi:hypothetical protein